MQKFVSDEKAVEGMPIRLIIALIVGVVVLGAMVSAIGEFKPARTMSASVVKTGANDLSGGNLIALRGSGEISSSFKAIVRVVDVDGNPVSGANVVISGLGGAGSNVTNSTGIAVIESAADIHLNENQNEGYLSIEVTASGFNNYRNDNAIKVVRVR
jgi:hypothetical protein